MMVGAQVVPVCNISSQIYCAAYFLVSMSIIFGSRYVSAFLLFGWLARLAQMDGLAN
jgi:hypothetical protein